MIVLPFIPLALICFTPANAAPLHKRVSQTTINATKPWEQACLAAGGGQQCNPIAVSASATLLAAAGPCDQQDAADRMVNLAKDLNDDPEMIRLAQIFAQQPRNSPESLSIPYCQSAPNNVELEGLFQCQFESVDKERFTTGAVGVDGTIPFGLNEPVNPAGSCPARTQGPVPDGEQLNTLVQNPRA